MIATTIHVFHDRTLVGSGPYLAYTGDRLLETYDGYLGGDRRSTFSAGLSDGTLRIRWSNGVDVGNWACCPGYTGNTPYPDSEMTGAEVEAIEASFAWARGAVHWVRVDWGGRHAVVRRCRPADEGAIRVTIEGHGDPKDPVCICDIDGEVTLRWLRGDPTELGHVEDDACAVILAVERLDGPFSND